MFSIESEIIHKLKNIPLNSKWSRVRDTRFMKGGARWKQTHKRSQRKERFRRLMEEIIVEAKGEMEWEKKWKVRGFLLLI